MIAARRMATNLRVFILQNFKKNGAKSMENVPSKIAKSKTNFIEIFFHKNIIDDICPQKKTGRRVRRVCNKGHSTVSAPAGIKSLFMIFWWLCHRWWTVGWGMYRRNYWTKWEELDRIHSEKVFCVQAGHGSSQVRWFDFSGEADWPLWCAAILRRQTTLNNLIMLRVCSSSFVLYFSGVGSCIFPLVCPGPRSCS